MTMLFIVWQDDGGQVEMRDYEQTASASALHLFGVSAPAQCCERIERALVLIWAIYIV